MVIKSCCGAAYPCKKINVAKPSINGKINDDASEKSPAAL